MPGASEYDSWDESEVVNFYVRVCCYCHNFFYSLVYIIFTTIKIQPRTVKKYPHREKTTPFPTRPVSWTPDRTVPRIKQNTAPWPESGRGCTVRSGDPRRSGVPRSSLLCSGVKHLRNLQFTVVNNIYYNQICRATFLRTMSIFTLRRYNHLFLFFIKKLISFLAGRPGPSGISGPDRATPKKFGSRGCILLNSGDGPVRDPGNGSGRERGSFLSVRVFLLRSGAKFW